MKRQLKRKIPSILDSIYTNNDSEIEEIENPSSNYSWKLYPQADNLLIDCYKEASLNKELKDSNGKLIKNSWNAITNLFNERRGILPPLTKKDQAQNRYKILFKQFRDVDNKVNKSGKFITSIL